jgi:DnaJ-class molecular chaperone
MKEFLDELEILGIPEQTELNLKELRRAFKKRSIAMLPEKHPTVANAHTQFEEVNAAFVKVMRTNK